MYFICISSDLYYCCIASSFTKLRTDAEMVAISDKYAEEERRALRVYEFALRLRAAAPPPESEAGSEAADAYAALLEWCFLRLSTAHEALFDDLMGLLTEGTHALLPPPRRYFRYRRPRPEKRPRKLSSPRLSRLLELVSDRTLLPEIYRRLLQYLVPIEFHSPAPVENQTTAADIENDDEEEEEDEEDELEMAHVRSSKLLPADFTSLRLFGEILYRLRCQEVHGNGNSKPLSKEEFIMSVYTYIDSQQPPLLLAVPLTNSAPVADSPVTVSEALLKLYREVLPGGPAYGDRQGARAQRSRDLLVHEPGARGDGGRAGRSSGRPHQRQSTQKLALCVRRAARSSPKHRPLLILT